MVVALGGALPRMVVALMVMRTSVSVMVALDGEKLVGNVSAVGDGVAGAGMVEIWSVLVGCCCWRIWLMLVRA